MDEDDLRRTLERMADRSPSAAAVAKSAMRRPAEPKVARTLLFWPLLAAAAVLLVVGATAAVLAVTPSHHSSAVALPAAATSIHGSATGPATSVVSSLPGQSDMQVCRMHLPTALLAQRMTVAGVTELGARPPGGWNARLGSFGASSPVTLCLIPSSKGFEAIAVTPDGKTYPRWTQSDGTMFMFPM